MGIIQRQGIKGVIVTYLGVGLGAVNTLFIYTLVFSKDQLGFFQFVQRTAMMLFPFAMLGVNGLVIRFFPAFRAGEKERAAFFSLLLLLTVTGLAIFSLVLWFAGPAIQAYYLPKYGSMASLLLYVIPLMGLMGLANYLTNYISNYSRIVVPALLNNPFQKIATGTLSLMFFFGWLSFEQFLQGLVIAYLLIVTGLLAYLHSLGGLRFHFRFSFISRSLWKSIGVYAIFGILGSSGSVLASQIDTFMVGTLIDLGNVAVFTIAFFIADVLDVPRKAIESISAPIVTRAWQEKDMDQIAMIYRKSALNQFLIGWLLLLVIWVNIDDIFALIPNGERYLAGKYVVLILGAGRIIDLVTGVNHSIISYSPFFRFNLWAVLALAVLNVVNNLIFIPLFQINGVALATMVSLLLFNALKLGYIYYRTRLLPFSINILWIALAGLPGFLPALFIPDLGHPLVSILARSALVTVLFMAPVLIFRLSPDVSGLAGMVLKKTGFGRGKRSKD